LCSVAREFSIVGNFYLGRPVPFLVNIPVLLRNLLRIAMPCFVPRISSIYMELEICREFGSGSHIGGIVVATTHQNGTHSMLTSAKLSEGYLVVGITRELNKEPLLHCSSIYINYIWFMLQQYLPALMSMPLSHVLLLRPPCHIHVP